MHVVVCRDENMSGFRGFAGRRMRVEWGWLHRAFFFYFKFRYEIYFCRRPKKVIMGGERKQDSGKKENKSSISRSREKKRNKIRKKIKTKKHDILCLRGLRILKVLVL